MNDLDRLMIERACERLVTEYCHFVDHGEAAKIAHQFTEDGVWASLENTLSGRDEIRKGFAARQALTKRMSRHVCNNFLVNVIDENTATGTVYLTLYRHDGDEGRATSPAEAPLMVGEYRDQFVRTAEGWRFKNREVQISFIRQ